MSTESVIPSKHLILCCPLLFLPSIFPSTKVFSNELALCISGLSIRGLASTSVIPVNIQGWSPFRLTGLISLLSRHLWESTPAPQLEGINSLAFCFLYGPALTTMCDHWEDHTLGYTDLCGQTNASAFQHCLGCHRFPAMKQSSSVFVAAVTSTVILEPKRGNLSLFPSFPFLFAMQ